MMRAMRLLAVALGLLVAVPAQSQEALSIIMERGYVAHWLVCGPFPSALDTPILAAVRAGQSPVGGRDFMEGDGGIERIRPKHRQPIKVPGYPDAVWQRAGTEGPVLDLAPFYPAESEGLSYAGFYTEAETATEALLELHTPLGAQVWLNGVRVIVSQENALPLAGVDRALVTFRQGSNFLVVQTPGARIDALSDAAGVSPRELSSQIFANRTMLQGGSGFDIALTLKRATRVGELVYLPQLQATGTFSGTLGDVRQDEALTLFNPGDARSSMVQIIAKSPQLNEPLLVEVPGVPPGERVNAVLSLPVGKADPGSAVAVNITLLHEGQSVNFDASFNVQPRGDGGEVLLLTGTRRKPKERETPEQAMQRQAGELSAQLALADEEEGYGFEAGYAALWQGWLALHPEALERWNELLATGRGGVSAQYAPLDERVASPELLVRNITLGLQAAEAGMGTPGMYDAWRAPGIAPQTPQLLAQAAVPGMLSSLPVSAMHPFTWQAGLSGASVLHRHVVASEGAVTVDGLRNDVIKRRRELSDLGFDVSLLLLENAIAPPEPFLRGATKDLGSSFPSIRISGGGPLRFFDTARQDPAASPVTMPRSSHSLQRAYPGELVATPELARALGVIGDKVAPVETLATLAALEGYRYPAAMLEQVWRSLSWYTQPAYLAARPGSDSYWRTWAALREASDTLQKVESDALAHLASLLAIPETALPEDVEALMPVVVYSPGGASAKRICTVEASVPAGKQVAAFDRNGMALPLAMGPAVAQIAPSTRPGSLRRFEVLLSIAPWTLEVIYLGLKPEVKVATTSELLIQNETWLAQFAPETGHLVQLLNKQTGVDHAAGALDEVLALEMDAAERANGRELWTSGEQAGVSGAPSLIETIKREGIEEIRMVSPFGGGQLERRIRLAAGLPYLEVEGKVTGVKGGKQLLVSAATTQLEGRAPVFGERFGAVTGRIGITPLDYRSDAMNRPSADGLYPAYHWAAVSAGPEIRFGLKRALPLVSAAIVRGPKPTHGANAQAVQTALQHAGIPATVHAANGGKGDALWTDGTPLPDALAALEPHAGMLVLIGSPEEVPLMKRVLEAQPEAERLRVARELDRGALYAASFSDGTPGGRAVPVLLFAGREPDVLTGLVEAFVEGLGNLGYYTVPEEALLDESVAASTRADHGLAVLFPGTSLAGVESDGRLVLAHGVHSGEGDYALHFRYALYPFEGDWRKANVPDVAEHYAIPVMSHEATVTAGKLEPGAPLLALSTPGLHVTTLKPAGTSTSVAEGLALRGYVDTLSTWQGEVSLRGPLTGAAASNLQENPGEALPLVAGGATASGTAGEILTTWLLPQSVGRRAASGAAGTTEPPQPTLAAYPEADQCIAPAGGIPCSVRAHMTWDTTAPSLTVHVANFDASRALEGTLIVSASDGWSIGPEKQPVRIEPGKAQSFDILVAAQRTRPGDGAVMATLQTDAGTWFDVVREGSAWLEVTQRAEKGRIVLDVVNRMGVRAQGSVQVVTAPAFWPGWNEPLTSEARPAVHPFSLPIDLPPLGKQQLSFLVAAAGDSPVRGVLLVTANGHAEQVAIGIPASKGR